MSDSRYGKIYRCHRCGQMNSTFEAFESGWPDHIRYWCLGHIPLRSKLKLAWQEFRRNPIRRIGRTLCRSK